MKRKRPESNEDKPRRRSFKQASSRTAPSRTLTRVRTSNVERKFVDLNQTGLAIDMGTAASSGSWTALAASALCNGVAPGTAANQRVGRKITMKSMYMRATIFGAGAISNGGPVRLLVVYDKQANGAFPVIAGADNSILAYDHMQSPNNLYSTDRYVTIFDEMVEPVSGLTNPGAPVCRHVTRYKKIDLPCLFNDGTAGTVADIQSGAIYFLRVGAGSGTAFQVDVTTRIRFVDE